MPQGFDQTTIDAAQSKFFRFVYLADLEFDSGTVRVHNGIGVLTFDGNDYLGVGEFGQVDPIKEGGKLQPYGITLTLSGVEDTYKNNGLDFYQTVKNEDVFNRKVRLYLAALSSTNTLLGTPRERFVGYMERPTVNRGKNNVVQIRAENELSNFDRVNGTRYTDSDLQNDHPGDLGFQFLSKLEDAKVIWRGANTNIGGGSGGSSNSGGSNQYVDVGDIDIGSPF